MNLSKYIASIALSLVPIIWILDPCTCTDTATHKCLMHTNIHISLISARIGFTLHCGIRPITKFTIALCLVVTSGLFFQISSYNYQQCPHSGLFDIFIENYPIGIGKGLDHPLQSTNSHLNLSCHHII